MVIIKFNKRISRMKGNASFWYSAVAAAVRVVRAIPNMAFTPRRGYDEKKGGNLHSSMRSVVPSIEKTFSRTIYIYIPHVLSPNGLQQPLSKETVLDQLRILTAFHPKKKIRLLAKKAYKECSKPIGYEPIKLSQAA